MPRNDLRRSRKAVDSRRQPFREKRPSPSQVFHLEVKVFCKLCKDIDTPRSLACALMAQAGEWQQYLELSFPDPLSPSFPDDYLVSEMMTKNPRLPLAIDKAAVAKQRFLDSEKACKDTNRRFRSLFESVDPSDHESRELIHSVSYTIRKSLGRLTPYKLRSLDHRMRFGPGATSSVSGRDVLLSKKYTSRWDVSPRLHPFVDALMGVHTGRVSEIRDSSRVTTVPKNAKTDRTICIEPHGNIYFQLGVGSLIRDALCALGLEPNDQSRNRDMAKTACERGYATIDLSMASDTIASQVVFHLLPEDWFELLWLGRVDFCDLDGQRLLLEKFSSMGNGFTWELESLIFYAVARQFTDEEIGVFGDDLVVPADIVQPLLKALNFFGFKVNERKSFWQGDFRESCGTDWWRGLDVRPVYLRKDNGRIQDLRHYSVQMANALRIYAHRRGDRKYCDRRFLPAWLMARREAGELGIRTSSSLGYTDDALIVNFDEASPEQLGRGWQGFKSVVCSASPNIATETDPFGAYLAALNHGSSFHPKSVEFCRSSVGRLHYKVVPVFDWYNLGPWM